MQNQTQTQMTHFLLVSLPAQGHINPTLQFAKRLVQTTGCRVTFAMATSAHRRILNSPPLEGISYAAFSDGYDDGLKPTDDRSRYIEQLKRLGSQGLTYLIRTLAQKGEPVTCIVYTMILGWVADMARDLGIPSAHLWIQPATVFAVYYHYFHVSDEIMNIVDRVNARSKESAHIVDQVDGESKENIDHSLSLKLPKLPPLTYDEIPTFLHPSNTYYTSILPALREQFEALDREERPRVLVNTFDALESESLKAIEGLNLVGVGPLIPSAFLVGGDESDTAFGGDLFKGGQDYGEWLDSQAVSSVVYVSFGTMVALSEEQLEEIATGLLESRRPFLWALRLPEDGVDTEFDAELRRRAGATERGRVVTWCSQVEVLSHRAVGCFVTHCGWNSTLESVSMGVPMVCCGKWTDQKTNAKLVEDAWKMGVRVRENDVGVFKGGELRRCLDEVMGGERGEEIKKNARKWKGLAREAAREGGSSLLNLQTFVEEVGSACSS